MAKFAIGFALFLGWGALQMVDNLMMVAGAR